MTHTCLSRWSFWFQDNEKFQLSNVLLGPFCFHMCLNTLGKDGAFPEGIALWFPNWEQEKVVHKSKVILLNNLVNIDKKIQMKVLEPWPGLFLSNKKTINFLGDLQKKLSRKKRATFFRTTCYLISSPFLNSPSSVISPSSLISPLHGGPNQVHSRKSGYIFFLPYHCNSL